LTTIQREFFELTESDIKVLYLQQKGESLESYFKRIVSKADYISNTASYIKILNIVRQNFYTLDLWYDIKYIDLVKEYYTAVYTKTATESEDVYYSRIIKKESWETEELYAKRVILVRDLFPTLPLWTEKNYFDKYTKVVYSTIYKKFSKESDEEYIKRIFAKDSFFDTSDEIWAKRIFLIQEATLSCSVWYEENYFEFYKSFYSVFYKKLEKETSEAWLIRALSPLEGESFEQAIKRVRFIKKVTGNCGCWSLDVFNLVKAKKCFKSEYLCLVEKEFFVTKTFFKSEKSQKSASSSSSSSSSSVEEVVANSADGVFAKKSASSQAAASSASSSESNESLVVSRGW